MESINQRVYSFAVLYEADPEGGYIASVPALSGCHTQGDTLEEAEMNIKEAIELYVESLAAEKREIPLETRVLQGTVNVAVPASLLSK